MEELINLKITAFLFSEFEAFPNYIREIDIIVLNVFYAFLESASVALNNYHSVAVCSEWNVLRVI